MLLNQSFYFPANILLLLHIPEHVTLFNYTSWLHHQKGRLNGIFGCIWSFK